jgi:hypothetical protein
MIRPRFLARSAPPPFASVLMGSARVRLAGAAALAGLLWLAVLWALQTPGQP